MVACIALEEGAISSAEVRCPSVAAIGYVPYYDHLSQLPSSSPFRSHPRRLAWNMLFVTGNASPPAILQTIGGFFRLTGSRDFRAALALVDVRVYLNDYGEVGGIRADLWYEIGYTPIRLPNSAAPPTMSTTPPAPLGYSGGSGGVAHRERRVGAAWEITAQVKFKIGRLGNVISFVTTRGHLAPSAWTQLECRFDAYGQVTVNHRGSAVPTQLVYVDWAHQESHDMLGITTVDIDNFVHAGSCKDAPPVAATAWP